MTAQSDKWLAEGIAAVKAGNKEAARKILTRVVQEDPNSEDGWLWLAATVSTPHATLSCLKRVLALNPQNAKALAGVRWATKQIAEEKKPLMVETQESAPTPSFDLFAQIHSEAVSNTSQVGSTTAAVATSTEGKEKIRREAFLPNFLILFLILLLVLGIVIIAYLLYAWLG